MPSPGPGRRSPPFLKPNEVLVGPVQIRDVKGERQLTKSRRESAHMKSEGTKTSSEQADSGSKSRLRAFGAEVPLHVVLVEPEIPPNTGNIARLCAATKVTLHLVHPLGFQVDEKAVRRAGLDYWPLVKVIEHKSLDAFFESLEEEARLWFFSGKTERSFLEVSYQAKDYLVFGKESTGLSAELLSAKADRLVAIPTLGEVRSLNLANAVALGVYQALTQLGAFAKTSLR